MYSRPSGLFSGGAPVCCISLETGKRRARNAGSSTGVDKSLESQVIHSDLDQRNQSYACLIVYKFIVEMYEIYRKGNCLNANWECSGR